MFMKRVTSGNAFQRIPSALPGSVFFDGFNSILGAGREEPAIIKREKRGNENLIESDEYDQGVSHGLSENRSFSSLRREEMD